MTKSYYITTPIYYVNDVPHIGHAYTTLACDVLARFKRLDGYDVKFLTGTDEHGQKVEKSAAAAGVDPLGFCDKVSSRFRDLAKTMNFSNDDFIRTTEKRHRVACQDLWKRLRDNDEIYLGNYSGWYSVRDEAYFAEPELIKGKDGEKLAPTGAPIEWVEEPSFFFPLSKWQQPLLDFYEKNPGFIQPNSRRNEVISFVKGGLRDLSISRTSFSWGVPVPDEPEHVMYVWIDALTNYMTGLGFPVDKNGEYAKFWSNAKHLIGKDILRFHAVYWPAFLLAAGLNPPDRVFAHGWWTNEGEKISKSLENVIDPFELIEEFGLDKVRYFLMREVPFGNDGDFSREAFINRTNADLANDLGNLAQRILSMIAKNCGNKVPAGQDTGRGQVMLGAIYDTLEEVRVYIDNEAPHKYLECIWSQVREANSYISDMEPWVLKKTNPLRMEEVLYTSAEALRRIAILTQPIMPDSMNQLLNQLGVPKNERSFAHLNEGFKLKTGNILPAPLGIFPRYNRGEKT